jgi:hypothetical protein
MPHKFINASWMDVFTVQLLIEQHKLRLQLPTVEEKQSMTSRPQEKQGEAFLLPLGIREQIKYPHPLYPKKQQIEMASIVIL